MTPKHSSDIAPPAHELARHQGQLSGESGLESSAERGGLPPDVLAAAVKLTGTDLVRYLIEHAQAASATAAPDQVHQPNNAPESQALLPEAPDGAADQGEYAADLVTGTVTDDPVPAPTNAFAGNIKFRPSVGRRVVRTTYRFQIEGGFRVKQQRRRVQPASRRRVTRGFSPNSPQ